MARTGANDVCAFTRPTALFAIKTVNLALNQGPTKDPGTYY